MRKDFISHIYSIFVLRNDSLVFILSLYLLNRSLLSIAGGDDQTSLISDDRKKRPRTAFTAAQIKALETEFEKNKYLSVSKRMQLSKQLKLTETQVEYF
jgi:hypothetical protein